MSINHTAAVRAILEITRKTAFLAFIAALVPQIAAAHVVRHNSIPQSYLGSWAPDSETCKESDKSVIALSAKTYVSSGVKCTVDWVSETPGPHGPIFSAHLQCSSPAAPPEKEVMSNLVIRPQNDHQIAMGPDFASLKNYRRCSASEPGATR
jgi:hypothetical protein